MENKKKQGIQFHRDDIVTHVPTCCLIEDYWILHTAFEAINGCNLTEARELIDTAMQCLQESIEQYTAVDKSLKITPSVSSAIAMGIQSGVIMNGNEDLKCRAGHPLSEADYCCKWGDCPYRDKCDPGNGSYLLEGDIEYEAWGLQNEDKFVEDLYTHFENE